MYIIIEVKTAQRTRHLVPQHYDREDGRYDRDVQQVQCHHIEALNGF